MAFVLVTQTVTLTTGSGNWQAPGSLYGTVRCQLWPPSSGGGGATATGASTGGGAGGSGYSEEPQLVVTPGSLCAYNIPSPGAGGAGTVGALGGKPADATFQGDTVQVVGHSGTPGSCSNSNGALGAGAPASSNTIAFGGGNGASGVASGHGGGGGGGAGSGGAGGPASTSGGGSGGSPDGGNGGTGATAANNAGGAGNALGGGGAGARGGSVRLGGAGVAGKIVLTFQVLEEVGGTVQPGHSGLHRGGEEDSQGAPVTPPPPVVVSPFIQPEEAEKGERQLRRGSVEHSAGVPRTPPPPVHVAPFREPGAVRGAKQLRRGQVHEDTGAAVVPFPAGVVNQWVNKVTQSVTWGQSLPGIASANVPLTPASSTGLGSGTPTEGNWLFCVAGWNAGAGPATINVGDDTHLWWRPAQPSNAAGASRCTIWYQPNIAMPTMVYVAPSAFVDGMSVTVFEVGGLGAWDQVTMLVSNYAAGATALPLSASAPGAPAFMVAAVCGDNDAAGTAMTPAGWSPLTTVTASNGVDHTGDAALAVATITTNLAQVVNGTASTAENLSGMLISVLENAPSPVPTGPGANPDWTYLTVEAAFGSGYMTPADEMSWTNLQTFANGMRLLSWDESRGIQYELDALESTEGQSLLQNPDGWLSPFNPASPWYPNVVPGTPLRLRGVAPGENRWRVIQVNIERFPQTWDEMLRGQSNTVTTDLWSVINKELATCYRAEVQGEPSLYAQWPCDDSSVNNPTVLVNAAPGNALPLQILTAPAGLASSVTVGGGTGFVFEFSAVQQFAQDGGWMYGDASAAAWSQTGTGTAATGRYLQCQDPAFPPLATGITIEAWRNYTWAKTAPPNQNLQFGPDGQPAAELYIWDVTTGGPGGTSLAHLSLDSSGHLRLTVGGSATTIYSSSDLRNATWFGVTVALTQTHWECWLNGGVVAHASGSASISSSAWDTYTVNANNNGTAGIGNPEVSHNNIYGTVLPAARVLAHFLAAYTAFGQLPQPGDGTIQFIPTQSPAPDGIMHTGTFFQPPTSFVGTNATLAVIPVASGGGINSAPPPTTWDWCQAVGSGAGSAGDYGWLSTSGPAAPQYSWYTANGAGREQLQATSVANSLFVNSYGSGASPPVAASALGDTGQNRLERILQAAGVTTPARCIDPAGDAMVAELDTGGQAAGSNFTNVVNSLGGMAFMANDGNLSYLSRAHLAAQPTVWQLGPDIAAGQIPYQFEGGKAGLDTDPQRCMNDIQLTQADVSGSGGSGGVGSGSGETHGGLVFSPDAARYPAIKASQKQNGYCQVRNTSYLQDTGLIQEQANWLSDMFVDPVQRIVQLTIEATAAAQICPQAWQFWWGASPGDVVQAFFTPPGAPAFSNLWRITKLTSRKLVFGRQGQTEASVTVICDFYPPTMWGI